MTHREKAEHNALNTVFYEELEMFDDPELEINITYLRRNWREHLKRKAEK